MFRLLLILLSGLTGSPMILGAADGLRVALTDFSSDDRSYRSLVVGQDFSDAMADLLYTSTEFEWVERQALHRAIQEIDLGASGLIDPAQAIRAGHWAGADLLLTGRFESDAEDRHLRLQVIDLQRADILGEKFIPMTGTRQSAIIVRQSEITEVVELAKILLKDSAAALQQRSSQKTVAPLFFRNLDTARRLDPLEEQFSEALARGLAEDPRLHLLTFPRVNEAQGEAELVVSGLADVDPTAWQRVANLYVWGEYREIETVDRPFPEVVIEARLTLWDGAGNLQQVVRQGQVREADALLKALVREVVSAAAALEDPTPNEAARASVARHLLDREAEVKRFMSLQPNGMRDPRGRATRQTLLETVSFFEPNNRYARWEKLLLRAGELDYRSPMWVHIAVTEDLARWFAQFGLNETPAELEEARVVLGRLASLVKHLDGKEYTTMLPSDIPTAIMEDWRRDWSERFVEIALRWSTGLQVAKENNFRLRYVLEEWMRLGMDHIEEPDTAVALVENIWPLYRNLLDPNRSYTHHMHKEFFSRLRQFYHRRSQPEKADELLAGLEDEPARVPTRERNQHVGGESLRTDQPARRTQPVRPPPKPGFVERVFGWFRGDKKAQLEEEQRLADLRAIRFPFSSVPDVEPRVHQIAMPRQESHPPAMLWRAEDLSRAENHLWVRGHVLGFAAHQSHLHHQRETFETARPQSTAFWSYDIMFGDGKFIWEKPANKGLVEDMELIGNDLWLASARAGLLRKDLNEEKIEEEFGLEQGVLSLNLFAVTKQDERLYFGGGAGGEALLGYMDLSTRNIFRIDLPEMTDGAGPVSDQAGGVRQIVSGDDWILVETNAIHLFNTTTGYWLEQIVSPDDLRPAEAQRRMQQFESKATTPAVYDGEAFWFGGRRSLLRFRPGRDSEPVEIIRRSPSAISFDGELIWAAFEAGVERRSNRIPTPSASGSAFVPVVTAWSPTTEKWVLRFQMNHRVTSIASDRDGLWLGVNDPDAPLVEVNRTALLAAVNWESGNPEGVARGNHTTAAAGPGNRLLRAVYTGKLPEVEHLIKSGAIDAASENQDLLLSIAARRGNFAVAKALLAAGLEPDGIRPDRTPLLIATETRQHEMVALLLRAGASPNGLGSTESPYPLLRAIEESDGPSVGLLLAFGANPDGPRRTERPERATNSPLITAVERGETDLVEVLLQAGADMDLKAGGKTALTSAVAKGNIELTRLLLERGADPDLRGPSRRTPLFLATGRDRDHLFNLLLDHGADPVPAAAGGQTPLGRAISENQTDQVDALLMRLGDPAQRYENIQRGTDALTRAVTSNDVRRVREFLEAGVNPNLSTDHEETPLLLLATREAYVEIARLLLAFGADLEPQQREHRIALNTGSMPQVARQVLEEARDLYSRTEDPLETFRDFARWRKMGQQDIALVEAAHRGDRNQVLALLDAGIGPDVRDHRGWTPLTYAMENVHTEMTHLLLNRGANPNLPTAFGSNALAIAATQADAALVRRLLEAGADPNLALHRSYHPIHIAAHAGDLATLDLLIRYGADVNQQGPYHHRPLSLAIAHQSLDCVDLLIRAGADIEARGYQLLHPIEQAAMGASAEILRRVIEAGAPIHPQTLTSITALERAEQYGRSENVRILKAAGAIERLQPLPPNQVSDSDFNSPLPNVSDLDALRVVVDEQGFDVNTVDGSTLLQQFLRSLRSQIPSVLFLIERGADVNLVGNRRFQTPPFVMAVEEADSGQFPGSPSDDDLIHLLQTMLEHGADVNVRHPHTLQTALMHAVQFERAGLVEFLLRAGADPHLIDIRGETAVDLLPRYKHPSFQQDPEANRRIRQRLSPTEAQ